MSSSFWFLRFVVLGVGVMPAVWATPLRAIQMTPPEAKKLRLGIVPFAEKGSIQFPDAGEMVASLIAPSFSTCNYILVERGRLEAIFKEHDLVASRIAADPSILRKKQIAGIDRILIGTISGINGQLALEGRIVTMRGVIERSARVTAGRGSLDALLPALNRLTEKLCLSGADRTFALAAELADRAKFDEAIKLLESSVTPETETKTKTAVAEYRKRKARFAQRQGWFWKAVRSKIIPQACKYFKELDEIAPRSDDRPERADRLRKLLDAAMVNLRGTYTGQHTRAQGGDIIIEINKIQRDKAYGMIELPKHDGGALAQFEARIVREFGETPEDRTDISCFRQIDKDPQVGPDHTYLILTIKKLLRGDYKQDVLVYWSNVARSRAIPIYYLKISTGELTGVEFGPRLGAPSATITASRNLSEFDDCLATVNTSPAG